MRHWFFMTSDGVIWNIDSIRSITPPNEAGHAYISFVGVPGDLSIGGDSARELYNALAWRAETTP